MVKLLASLTLVLLLWGCATPYGEYNYWTGGGFDEVQIDNNSWRVSFKGSDNDDKDRIANLCLLRCSEIALQNGFTYFAIVSQENTKETGAFTTPTVSTTNIIGNIAVTNTYGGQTFFSSAPSSSNEIICFKEKPNDIHTYNAEFVVKSIKAKYEVE